MYLFRQHNLLRICRRLSIVDSGSVVQLVLQHDVQQSRYKVRQHWHIRGFFRMLYVLHKFTFYLSLTCVLTTYGHVSPKQSSVPQFQLRTHEHANASPWCRTKLSPDVEQQVAIWSAIASISAKG